MRDDYDKKRPRPNMTGKPNPSTSASKCTRAVKIDGTPNYDIERLIDGDWEFVASAYYDQNMGVYYMDGNKYSTVSDMLEAAESRYK
jgi:transglutaminase/protease-like cytokinesis protein 3